MRLSVSIVVNELRLAINQQDIPVVKIEKVMEFINKAIYILMMKKVDIQIDEKSSWLKIYEMDMNELNELKPKLEELKKLAKEFDKELKIELKVKL